MSAVAKKIEEAWTKTVQEKGFREHAKLGKFAAQEARRQFYLSFSTRTGLDQAIVTGLYFDWCRLPEEEAVAIKRRHNVESGFCAFIAEHILRTSSSFATDTGYSEGDCVGGTPH